MKKSIFTFLFALVLGTLAFSQSDEKRTVYLEPTAELVERALKDLEYEFEEIEDKTYRFQMSGMTVLLFTGETDLQLYCGIQHETSHYRINTFNKDYKWGRAYVDNDGDPVLESDISFIGGLGYDGLVSFFTTYQSLLDTFLEHIK